MFYYKNIISGEKLTRFRDFFFVYHQCQWKDVIKIIQREKDNCLLNARYTEDGSGKLDEII